MSTGHVEKRETETKIREESEEVTVLDDESNEVASDPIPDGINVEDEEESQLHCVKTRRPMNTQRF